MAACSGATVGQSTTTTFDVPATSTTTAAESTTTLPATSATTTSTIPLDDQAWSAADAERWVTDYLAALAAGAFGQAASPAESAGVVLDGQSDDELPRDFLRRRCVDNSCAGPYEVEALGPGVVDSATLQASSKVVVTHLPTGESSTVRLGTLEGSLVISDLPPLVPSEPVPTLVERLFGPDVPGFVVVARLDAFEVWTNASSEWFTNWWADETQEVEGGWAVVWHPAGHRLVSIFDPQETFESDCPSLVSRNGVPLVLERCWADSWVLVDPATGEEVASPVDAGPGSDGEYVTFIERADVVVAANGDAEGNLTSAATLAGVDLLGDAYAGLDALSTDGAYYAFVDHADPAAASHFWSPVVAVVDTATGHEVGRWVLGEMIGCLEFSVEWLVACEVVPDPNQSVQVALTAINITTGEVRRVETPSRVFLPIPPP